ncbi:MAG: hypothetical protein EZS28_047791, partial [Streblomastix strix]
MLFQRQSGTASFSRTFYGANGPVVVIQRAVASDIVVKEDSSNVQKLKDAIGQLGEQTHNVVVQEPDANAAAAAKKGIAKQVPLTQTVAKTSKDAQQAQVKGVTPGIQEPSPVIASTNVTRGEQEDVTLVTTTTLLLPVCRSSESQRIEIWPALLCKALCKIAVGCEDTLIGGGGPAVVSWLCGVIPHTVIPNITRLPSEIITSMNRNKQQRNDDTDTSSITKPLPLSPDRQIIDEKDLEMKMQPCDILDTNGFEFRSKLIDSDWWEFLRTLLDGDDPTLPFFGLSNTFPSEKDTTQSAQI